MIIQGLLAGCFILGFTIYLSSFRSRVRDRFLALGMLVLALVAITFPNITSVVANAIGVGRGTDLVTYMTFSCGAVLIVLLYAKISATEATLTKVIRHIAIIEASKPETK
jgi:hypothetical protein